VVIELIGSNKNRALLQMKPSGDGTKPQLSLRPSGLWSVQIVEHQPKLGFRSRGAHTVTVEIVLGGQRHVNKSCSHFCAKGNQPFMVACVGNLRVLPVILTCVAGTKTKRQPSGRYKWLDF